MTTCHKALYKATCLNFEFSTFSYLSSGIPNGISNEVIRMLFSLTHLKYFKEEGF